MIETTWIYSDGCLIQICKTIRTTHLVHNGNTFCVGQNIKKKTYKIFILLKQDKVLLQSEVIYNYNHGKCLTLISKACGFFYSLTNVLSQSLYLSDCSSKKSVTRLQWIYRVKFMSPALTAAKMIGISIIHGILVSWRDMIYECYSLEMARKFGFDLCWRTSDFYCFYWMCVICLQIFQRLIHCNRWICILPLAGT